MNTSKIKTEHGFLDIGASFVAAGAAIAIAAVSFSISAGSSLQETGPIFEGAADSSFCIEAHWVNKPNIVSRRGQCAGLNPEIPETEIPEPLMRPAMVTRWSTTIDPTCKEISLPISGEVDVSIDWGDGSSVSDVTESNPTHTYSDIQSEVTITVNGTFENWGSQETLGEDSVGWEDSRCLLSVDKWHGTETTNLQFAFIDSDNLENVQEIPLTTTNLYGAFYRVDSDFTIGDFNTSNVTDMEAMFHEATAFNQPLDFDTSKVTTMHEMFCWARSFDQELNFDTSNVTDMGGMLETAQSFNRPLNFSTSKVNNMSRMLYDTSSFNHDLSTWDVSSVTSREDFNTRAGFEFTEPNWVN